MHIVGLLFGALATLGVILWRLHVAAEAAKGLAETAEAAHGIVRRWRWRRKATSDSLAQVENPREAAAAMMVAVAQSDGALTERERQAILTEITTRFEATARQAEDLLALARWIVRDVHDIDRALARLTPVVARTLTASQRRELIQMLEAVAAAEATPEAIEREAIARLARALDFAA
jgi:uncharacterized tellurite resistance protein B-like protein